MSPLIHEKLHCFGYYGFGTGYGLQDAVTHCNGCPRGKDCWTRHKHRVHNMMPGPVDLFEEIVKKHPGDAWGSIEEFKRATGLSADPYLLVMGGNVQDGAAVRCGRRPRDRGKEGWSLSWPLVSLETH